MQHITNNLKNASYYGRNAPNIDGIELSEIK